MSILSKNVVKFVLISFIAIQLSHSVEENSSVKKNLYITMFSGVYAMGKVFNVEITNRANLNPSSLSNKGNLHIMLKDSSNKMLVGTKISSSFEYEVLTDSGGYHEKSEDVVPILVKFPYQAKAVKVVVAKIATDGKETVIFSKKLPVDKNPQHLFSSSYSISTEKNFPILKNTSKVELLNKKAIKGVSSSFTKFMYAPPFEFSFDYNACNRKSLAGDGIALLLGKDPKDYKTKQSLVRKDQGVKFNKKGLSVHLDMSGKIQLKNGEGKVLTEADYKVKTACNKWKNLKLAIEYKIDKHKTENYNIMYHKLRLIQENKTLFGYDLKASQLEGIISHPIGFNAYSAKKGQYAMKNIVMTALSVQ